MRGEGSNSFPSGNFYFNGELGNIQQHNDENHVSFGQLLGDDFWLAPLGDQATTTTQRSEATSHSIFNPFIQNNISQGSIEHGPINSPSPLQHNLDLNVVGNRNDASQGTNGPYLSLDLLGAGTGTGTSTGNHHIQTSGGSSSPVMIYSGVAGYVLEENIIPSDGQRRLLCKRKAPQFASGDGSSSRRQAENSEQLHNNLISSLNAASNSGLGVTLPTPSNLYQVATEDRQVQVDNFQRNTRLRRTAGQSIPTSTNLWTLNNNVQPTGQHPTTLTSSGAMPMLVNPGMQPVVQVSNSSQAPQPSQYRNGTIVSRLGPSSISTSGAMPMLVNPGMQPIAQVSNPLQAPQPSQYRNGTIVSRLGPSPISHDHTVNVREAALQQAENLRNNRRNMMISLANMQANMNLANRNANLIGNVASSSRIQPGSGMHLPYSSTRSPHPEPWRLGNYCPLVNSSASPVVQDIGNTRHAQVPLRLGPRVERQANHRSGVSPTALSQTSAQRRRRLVSEVRNALGLVRRAGALRLEDVMVIDRSFLYGIPEGPDIVEDMHIDVDNMSYEELLALEEQIGNVCTGLTEEAILTNLRRRKYQSITIGPPVEIEPCCICQDDYADGEELGKLDCGHDFHFNCIKQWLVHKNSCPICKRTALAI